MRLRRQLLENMNANLLLASLAVGFAIGMIFLSRRLFGTAWAPLGIMGGIWGTCLTLKEIHLVHYINTEYWIDGVYCLTLLSFTVGAVIAYAFRRKSIRQPLTRSNSGFLKEVIPASEAVLATRTAYTTFGLALIGAAKYYWTFNRVVGISALWRDRQEVRHVESLGVLREAAGTGLELLFVLMVPSVVLLAISLVLDRSRFIALRAILLLLSMLTLALNSGRTALFSGVVAAWVAIALLHSIGRITAAGFRRLKLAAIVLACLLVLNFQVSNVALNKDLAQTEFVGMDNIPEQLRWTASLYHYLVGPLIAFSELLQHPYDFTDTGNLTFGAVARILHALDPDSFKYPMYVRLFSFIPIPTNVYTYLDAFYIDFGWIGVFLMPMFWGCVCTGFYLSMRARPTCFSIFTASVFGYCCISSTGVNRFGTLEIWLWLSFTFSIATAYRLFSAKRPLCEHDERQSAPKRIEPRPR
jgi:oligosaccharide repeat unit polymerase